MDKLKLYQLEKLLNQESDENEKDALAKIEKAKKSLNLRFEIKLDKEGKEETGVKYTFTPFKLRGKKKEKKEEDIKDVLKLLSSLHEKALLNDDEYIYYFRKFLSLYLTFYIQDKIDPFETWLENKLSDFSSSLLKKEY